MNQCSPSQIILSEKRAHVTRELSVLFSVLSGQSTRNTDTRVNTTENGELTTENLIVGEEKEGGDIVHRATYCAIARITAYAKWRKFCAPGDLLRP